MLVFTEVSMIANFLETLLSILAEFNYCGLHGINPSTGIQFIQSLFQAFWDRSMLASYSTPFSALYQDPGIRPFFLKNYFTFTIMYAGMVKSTRRKVLFLSINTRSGLLI